MSQTLKKLLVRPEIMKLYILAVFMLCSIFPITIALLIRKKNLFLFHSLLIISGWLTWTITEYFFHRFLMHTHKNHPTTVSKKHSSHHHSPSVFEVNLLHRILLFLFSCLFFWLAAKWNNYFSFFAGFFWGAAAFCYIHYLLHHRLSKIFLPVHHYFHICHHCKFPDKCFGVSVPWWDYLFLTAPPEDVSISSRVINFYYLPAYKH